MEASSTTGMSEDDSKIQPMKCEACPLARFCAIPEVAMKGDSMDALSLIPPKVIMIHDVKSYYSEKL